MATYNWSIPEGKEILGSTKIKDADNKLKDTIDDLVDFVNGAGVHVNQGLTFDLIDKTTAQTITGTKTFSNAQFVSGGVTPAGGIIIWSGTTSNIPNGWYLCDGSNETPDLTGSSLIYIMKG